MFRISDITSMIRGWRFAARVHNTRAVLADAWPALVTLLGVIGAAAIGAIGYWSFRQDPSTAITISGVTSLPDEIAALLKTIL